MIYQTARDKILHAAKNRFGYYGFKKTSMVEIAEDCDMSAANIYRHFTGKKAILAVLAMDIFAEEEKQLTKLCNTKFSSTSQKLLSFFMESLLLTHHYATEKPKMKEMVDYICKERSDLVTAHRDAKTAIIALILQEGVDSKEFAIDDIYKTANTLKSATVLFHTPLFFEICSLEELKTACSDVINLLLTAITSSSLESTCKK